MADVKKINFDNGDEYDIKDEEARNQIQELNEALTELRGDLDVLSVLQTPSITDVFSGDNVCDYVDSLTASRIMTMTYTGNDIPYRGYYLICKYSSSTAFIINFAPSSRNIRAVFCSGGTWSNWITII